MKRIILLFLAITGIIFQAKSFGADIHPPDYSWVKPLLLNYIKHSNSDLVKYAREHKLNEEADFDQIIKTDTATYLRFNVGHDVSDGGKDLRFILDACICIDTKTRILYEYDSADNRLIPVKK